MNEGVDKKGRERISYMPEVGEDMHEQALEGGGRM